MRKPSLFVVFMTASALVLAACGGDSAASKDEGTSINVKNCDREVRIKKPIERAVVIGQPAVEMLLSLGLKDRIAAVGIDEDTHMIPEVADDASSLKEFGKRYPTFERVLDEDPDFLYTTYDYTFTSEGIASHDRFTKFGVEAYQSPSECGGEDAIQDKPLELDDIYDEIDDVATLFDVKDRGDKLTKDLKKRANKAGGDLDADNVTIAWWYAATKTPFIGGCCGAPGIMTGGVGAQNAYEDNKQLWPEISWESLLDRDPTVLVLADLTRGGDGDSAEEKIKFLESDPVASKLTAVRKQRYIVIPGEMMDPGVSNIEGIERLADGLHRLKVVQ